MASPAGAEGRKSVFWISFPEIMETGLIAGSGFLVGQTPRFQWGQIRLALIRVAWLTDE